MGMVLMLVEEPVLPVAETSGCRCGSIEGLPGLQHPQQGTTCGGGRLVTASVPVTNAHLLADSRAFCLAP